MKIRTTFATLVLTGLAVGTAAADATGDRLVADGFLPAEVESSTLVERAPAATASDSLLQAAAFGFTGVDQEVVGRYGFEQQPERELSATEEALQAFGVVPERLRLRAGETPAGSDALLSGTVR